MLTHARGDRRSGKSGRILKPNVLTLRFDLLKTATDEPATARRPFPWKTLSHARSQSVLGHRKVVLPAASGTTAVWGGWTRGRCPEPE